MVESAILERCSLGKRNRQSSMTNGRVNEFDEVFGLSKGKCRWSMKKIRG
jgi:hypothetical protein